MNQKWYRKCFSIENKFHKSYCQEKIDHMNQNISTKYFLKIFPENANHKV